MTLGNIRLKFDLLVHVLSGVMLVIQLVVQKAHVHVGVGLLAVESQTVFEGDLGLLECAAVQQHLAFHLVAFGAVGTQGQSLVDAFHRLVVLVHPHKGKSFVCHSNNTFRIFIKSFIENFDGFVLH